MHRWIMHVDMDAFFASVEQYRNHPELIGRPVCVGHDPRRGEGRGVVRAASYEARAFGIRSGMPVSVAYRLCPEAVFISGRFSDYQAASAELARVLRRFADRGMVRKASIDEAFLDVSESVTHYDSPRALAEEVQTAVRKETRLPCSIGVGPNMTVAKIATSSSKPNGMTVVGPSRAEVLKFLAPLPVDAIPGVGPKSAARLASHGITTIGQVQRMQPMDLYALLGRWGLWLHERANGIDDRPVLDSASHGRKSISKDHTFMEDVDGWDEGLLCSSLLRLCDRVAEKLTQRQLGFRTVTVRIRYSDFTTVQKTQSLRVCTVDQGTFRRIALSLLDQRDHSRRVRMIGVKVGGLEDVSTQTLLVQA